MQVALALLQKCEKQLLLMADMEEIVHFLKAEVLAITCLPLYVKEHGTFCIVIAHFAHLYPPYAKGITCCDSPGAQGSWSVPDQNRAFADCRKFLRLLVEVHQRLQSQSTSVHRVIVPTVPNARASEACT